MKTAGIVLMTVFTTLLLVLLFLSGSGVSYNQTPCSHSWQPATFDSPARCSRCYETMGEKLTPAPEWGFNNLSEMENCLIEIVSYNDSYVLATGNAIRFENGYMLNQSFSVKDTKCVFAATSNPQKYSIVNNDNLDINNGYKSFRFSERKTILGRDNFVCFVKPSGTFESEQWFVPYSLIDWEHVAKVYSVTEHGKEIMLYLVS